MNPINEQNSNNYRYHHSTYRPYSSKDYQSNFPSNNPFIPSNKPFTPPNISHQKNNDNNYPPLLTNNNPSSSSLPPLNKTLSTSTLSFNTRINLPPLNMTSNLITDLSTSNSPLNNYIPSNNDTYYVNQHSSYFNSYYHNYPHNNHDYKPIFNNYRKRYHPYYYGPQMFSFRPYQFNPTPRSYTRNRIDNKPYDQSSHYATKDEMKTILAESGIPELKYKLEVIQQPVRARMCGFGERDRRPISPLPFLRLRISDENGPVDIHEIDPGFFIIHASLYEEKTNREAMLVVHPSSMPGSPQCVDNLVGEKTAHGKRLCDTQGVEDIWFIFRDLSVRAEGIFYIKFTLTYLGWQGNLNTGEFPIKMLETVCSNPFTVYTAKRFPGMIETTRLAYCFVQQGNKIPTRRDPTKKLLNEVNDDTEDTRKSKKRKV
ncbi:velvet factor-domain-containing protein [Rhizophagus diaphanus]|nr:velvet factor-domain-containing protein [Rhizophagus diaphanus] [Rhizophagus sp. MUCL 43196]